MSKWMTDSKNVGNVKAIVTDTIILPFPHFLCTGLIQSVGKGVFWTCRVGGARYNE